MKILLYLVPFLALFQLLGATMCPDASFCPGTETCCPLSQSNDLKDYGCCPFSGATCCSDHKQCCPAGDYCITSLHICLRKKKSTKRKGGSSVTISFTSYLDFDKKNKIETTRTSDQPCGTGSCPDNYTCCGERGCCPLPNAICCTDGVHCCPQGMQCDLIGRGCVTPNDSLSKSVRNIDQSPSLRPISQSCGSGSCTNDSICCNNIGCCPSSSAVCCSDNKHCCPEGWMCDIKHAKCVAVEGFKSVSSFKSKVMSKSSVKGQGNGTIICPDEISYCPDTSTCCQLIMGQWGCCPYVSAVCCSDKIHCCPQGTVCDMTFEHCLSH